jgi:hypothetical protein
MTVNANPYIVTSGLKLLYEAGNPRSYPGSGTSWLDVSGLNNNGVLTNGPTYTSGTNGYFTFDGVNDYVNTVTATTLGINSVSTPFTFSIWCKTSGTVEYYLFDNYNGSTQDISFRLDGTNSGAIEVYLMASNGTGFNTALFGSNYNNNAWHNLCITYDGINTLTGYADGSLLGTSTQSGMSGNFESGAALQIGARPLSSSYFPGTISTMMVYNIALTAAQISQNFNALRGRYGI